MAPEKPGEGEATPSLNEALAELGPRQLALGKLDVKIVDAVKKLEEKLRARLSTRVVTSISLDETTQRVEVLAFGKLDGRWQLLIETGELDEPEFWKKQPLVSASREMRVRVFTGGFMEQLVRDAAKQLDEQIADRHEALKIADNLIDALGEEADDGIPF
jgi:Rad3-related DNA helicase